MVPYQHAMVVKMVDCPIPFRRLLAGSIHLSDGARRSPPWDFTEAAELEGCLRNV